MPAKIQLLHPAIAEKIAAGEVIERPASVVKELIENSLDAGASEIAVILEDGGKSLIEILDNGSGMPPEDLALSIQRHATSKLRELSDLERLRSLGFRGEALPSVAAVSELSILSRPEGTSQAHELAATGSEGRHALSPITFGHFLGSPHGTRVRARGLFSQIPARLKFLKSSGAEVTQVREWIERLALTHPSVGFKLVSDDRTILNLRPASIGEDTEEGEVHRVRQILADDGDYPILTARSDQSYQGFSLRIHWVQGLSLSSTKKLVQVVNRRALRDRLLQQALLSPFRQALLPGQFPALALFLEIDPAEIDVNVHPTKTEMRFLDSRKIFRALESLASSLIEQHGAPSFVAGAAASLPFQPSPVPAPSAFHPTPPPTPQPLPFTRSGYSASYGGEPLPLLRAQEPAPAAPLPETATLPPPFEGAQFCGILFNTYLMYDLGAEAALIDQHAAHERIRFERLRERWRNRSASASQQLLIPEAASFPPEQRALVESRLPWLEQLGFEAEVFGENSLLFRAIPGEWGTQELGPRLKNLTERVLEEEGAGALDATVFEKLASESCHSAIRAGDRIDAHVARRILEDLFRCEHPWNCPHGRPTVVRIPRGRFEEWFQRRV